MRKDSVEGGRGRTQGSVLPASGDRVRPRRKIPPCGMDRIKRGKNQESIWICFPLFRTREMISGVAGRFAETAGVFMPSKYTAFPSV